MRVASTPPSASLRLRTALRDALLKVTRHLPRRPEPRWQWDELAAEANGVGHSPRMRNAFAVTGMLRAALTSAQQEGPQAFEETRGLVAAFLAIQETEVFRGFEMPAPECRIVAAADVAEELSEATVAAVQFAANPTPMNRERALEETMEARCVVDRYARQLTRGQWLTPMSA
jgi:hypothetical protein